MRKIVGIITLVILLSVLSMPNYANAVDLNMSGSPSKWATTDLDQLTKYELLDQWIFKSYQDSITRLDFIYLAVKLYETITGEEIQADPKISFIDTNNSYVLKGATIGITSGVGNDKFGPEIKLTREQLATMMVKALELTGNTLNESSYRFTDDKSVSSYAKSSIYKAYNHKIINGFNNSVNPKGGASIEQALLIFKNIYENFVLYPESGSQPTIPSNASKLNSEEVGKLATSVVKIYVEDAYGNFSTGSGFFFESGKIGTNYHVIDQAKAIAVEFDDGTYYEGDVRVLGYDVNLDLAVISIQHKSSPVLALGDSSKVLRGQNVYTIGSPQGLMNTLSNGLVSSIRENSIQITAPISPGSSGGVLLDEYGKVIGITSSGIIEGENLGFAIPINLFKSMSKVGNLTLSEFVGNTSQSKQVSYVFASPSSSNEVLLSWEDNGADFYYIYDRLNNGEWIQVKNAYGNYDFYSKDSTGVTITGYYAGQKVSYAVCAYKQGVQSEFTYSTEVAIKGNFNSDEEIANYLDLKYSSIILNNYVVYLSDYSVSTLSTGEKYINTYINTNSFLNYSQAESADFRAYVGKMRNLANLIKADIGVDLVLTVTYSDYYNFYPSGFVANNIYDKSVRYDSYKGGYYIFYPLIQLETQSSFFKTWFMDYLY